MELQYQHHTLATELPVPTEQQAALFPESVWTLGEKLCVFCLLGVEPWFIVSVRPIVQWLYCLSYPNHNPTSRFSLYLLVLANLYFLRYGLVKSWLIKMCCIVLLIHWINAYVLYHVQKFHPFKKSGYWRPSVMLKDVVRLKFFT
jgi:lipid-A-disaccharide synthase-like uncharacterized protein